MFDIGSLIRDGSSGGLSPACRARPARLPGSWRNPFRANILAARRPPVLSDGRGAGRIVARSAAKRGRVIVIANLSSRGKALLDYSQN
jgi:hypothetical protein